MGVGTVVICASGVFFFYFYYGILQERLFRHEYEHVSGKDEDKERFQFVTVALCLQCISSSIASFLALHVREEASPFDDVNRNGQFPILAAAYLGAMMCSNWALKYVSYPTQVIGKSCKPIPIMIIGVLYAGKKYKLQKYFFVAMIVAGVSVFTYKGSKAVSAVSDEDKLSTYGIGIGEILLLLSLSQDGLIAAIQDRMKVDKERKRPSAYQMMFSMNIWSSLFAFVLTLAFQELAPFTVFISNHPTVAYNLFMFCACSVLGQVFIFKAVTELSPLTCSIITTTRKCFTVLTSVLLFGNTLLMRQWLGVVLVFTGLFLDNIFA